MDISLATPLEPLQQTSGEKNNCFYCTEENNNVKGIKIIIAHKET